MKVEYEVIKLLIFEMVKCIIEIFLIIFWNGLYIICEWRIGCLKLVKVKVVYCCFIKYFGYWFVYNMVEKKGCVFCKFGWIMLFFSVWLLNNGEI